MSTHNICFRGEIRKIFTGYPPLSIPMIYYCTVNQFHSLQITICYVLPYIKVYIGNSHLNCLDTSRQFKGGPTTHFHKENQKKNIVQHH